MTRAEQVAAELDILGMDYSSHILDGYRDFLEAVGVHPTGEVGQVRNGGDILVAGAKVATQTPPIRSGKRVIFTSLDDATGPVDLAYFSDTQQRYATTIFTSWLLLACGKVRRTGPNGVSMVGTGAWDVVDLHQQWTELCASGMPPDQAGRQIRSQCIAEAIRNAQLARQPQPAQETKGAAPTSSLASAGGFARQPAGDGEDAAPASSLASPGGFARQPVGDGEGAAPASSLPSPRGLARERAHSSQLSSRKLWHASPGSAGR